MTVPGPYQPPGQLQQHYQAQPSTHMAPLQPRSPTWLKGVLAFTGACTPGGFLFLIALLAETSINFAPAVWFVLAAAGGVAGWFLASKAFSAT